ncbi:MAG TPA: thymidine phosphorylase [Fimbriimonadaceae bacterium]|nr:thymidine phosphorylase [Fimbriimonadaceae bacterium]
MTFLDAIVRRRDGLHHTREELDFLAKGAGDKSIPDYQLSAWLMAAYLNPLSIDETVDLTLAMADSGERLDLTGLPKPWVDKHSTGGVGDKTTIVLLPLLAACGLTCVKMSGRGLGITGGTIDKLESIPGMRLDLGPSELISQAREIGLALTGQTPNLAPADKTLYALRDTTGTVASLPLIVSSILSKKLAGGAETVVLDVKCGSGAFMKTPEEANALASWLSQVGQRCGLNLRLVVSDMFQPLGRMIGNSLEVEEALAVLDGEPSPFADFCATLAGITLAACGLAPNEVSGKETAQSAIESGSARKSAALWIEAQGGDLRAFSQRQRAPYQIEVLSPLSGAAAFDAGLVGQAVVALGGGRQRKEDRIDSEVGIELLTDRGDAVSVGQPIARIHARTAEAAQLASETIIVGFKPMNPSSIILGSG